MENNHFLRVNQLFLRQFSIAMLVYQRVLFYQHESFKPPGLSQNHCAPPTAFCEAPAALGFGMFLYLVGGWPTRKIWQLASWDNDIPNGKLKMFQTTNQFWWFYSFLAKIGRWHGLPMTILLRVILNWREPKVNCSTRRQTVQADRTRTMPRYARVNKKWKQY